MNHGKLAKSPRLQRVHAFLKEAGGEVTTMEIVVGARAMAVSAVISELRANGAEINCRQEHRETGRVWLYTLIKAAPEKAVA